MGYTQDIGKSNGAAAVKGKMVMTCLFLILLMSFFLTGCTGSNVSTQEPDKQEDPDKMVIGMSFDSFLIERWQRDRDVFVDTCKELGARVNVQNANGDVETQISQIRYLISKKVNAIVIVGIDADALSDVCSEARDAGIPIIAYDRMIHNGGASLYISFDNRQVGQLMGEGLAKELSDSDKVLMLAGPTEDPNVGELGDGFESVMKEKGIEIVDKMHCDGWKPELAAEYINENIDLLDEVDGIMCGNDNIATAVYRVLAERRRAGRIKLVGQDADLEACQRIVQGTQVMTVYKPVEKEAKAAAEYACKLAAGESLPDLDTKLDGTYLVPYVLLDPIAVDKNNIDETVIDAGFHLKEDVYLYAD